MSCDKDEPTIENQTGTVHTNSSGPCILYIQLDSGLKLEPVNRDIVDPFLVEGKRVTISYQEAKDFVSACDNATAVVISTIK